jgi:hypothetical protein
MAVRTSEARTADAPRGGRRRLEHHVVRSNPPQRTALQSRSMGCIPSKPSAQSVRTPHVPGDTASPRPAAEPSAAARPRPDGLPARPTRAADTADLEQASYVLARRVTGRPLSAEAQSLQRAAHQSRREVLALMPYGRSNVQTDLDATANTGLHRRRAEREVLGSLSTVGTGEHRPRVQEAALTARAGAGNCNEFANLAMHVHAGRLQPGEQLQMQRADADHAWVVVQGAATPMGSRPAAVIDGWGEGPVIEPVDGVVTAGTAGELQTLHSIDSNQAAALHEDFNTLRHEQGSSNERRLQAVIARQARDDLPLAGRVYAPAPIIGRELAEAAQQAIAAHPSRPGLHREAVEALLAVRPSLPEALAEEAASAVIEMASTLREPRARALQPPPDPIAPARVSSESSLGVDSDADVPQSPH